MLVEHNVRGREHNGEEFRQGLCLEALSLVQCFLTWAVFGLIK